MRSEEEEQLALDPANPQRLMGASQSVSHFAHRDRDDDGRRHRLMHVGSNTGTHPCGMCSQNTELGAEVYRCRRCPFVLHADCYSRPEKIHDHFAHAHPSHTLELTISSGGHHQAAPRQQCNICAVEFDVGGGRPSYFIYGCGKCCGFYAHPRCAALPPTLDHALHPHKLTLLSPPRWRGHGRSRCINAAGNCQNASRLTNNACSYQCNSCHVELCLACQLPRPDGAAAVHQRNGGGDSVGCAHHVGATIGTFFHAMGCACLGVQTQRP